MIVWRVYFIVFFFKQMTAYEVRISDWSSDVCSSDLRGRPLEETDAKWRQACVVGPSASGSVAEAADLPGPADRDVGSHHPHLRHSGLSDPDAQGRHHHPVAGSAAAGSRRGADHHSHRMGLPAFDRLRHPDPDVDRLIEYPPGLCLPATGLSATRADEPHRALVFRG